MSEKKVTEFIKELFGENGGTSVEDLSSVEELRGNWVKLEED